MIESVRLFVVLLCFGYTAYLDYRFREVPNWVWLVFCIVGTPLTLCSSLLGVFGVIIPTVLLALFLWYIGGFGGADAKALITLSLLLPTGFDNSTPYFPLVSLAFGCVISLPYVLYALSRKQNLKKLELPLLVFLFLGILLSLFVGKWFIELIL